MQDLQVLPEAHQEADRRHQESPGSHLRRTSPQAPHPQALSPAAPQAPHPQDLSPAAPNHLSRYYWVRDSYHLKLPVVLILGQVACQASLVSTIEFQVFQVLMYPLEANEGHTQ